MTDNFSIWIRAESHLLLHNRTRSVVAERQCDASCQYFAKSLKVIQDDTLVKDVSPYQYFDVTMSVSRTVFKRLTLL